MDEKTVFLMQQKNKPLLLERQDIIVAQLIQQENQLFNRVEPLNVLADLIDDEFIEVGSSAACYNKSDVIDWLSGDDHAQCVGTSFQAHTLSADMILLIYMSTIKAPPTSDSKQAMRSSIWRLTGGKWRLVFHQGTPMK